jgi:hypothetical protein
MTPQQERIFSLQASRNWGPFTADEIAHLNRMAIPNRRNPADVQRPYVADLIRVLRPGETLENIQTIQMPGEER